jgi:hypothetical protein
METLFLIGMMLSAFGTVASVSASNRARRYQASIARRNAEIAGEQARLAEMEGAAAAAKHKKGADLLMGQQAAGYAGAGVDVWSGSPLVMRQQTEEFAVEDALTIRHNAALRAWGYRAEAAGQHLSSDFYRRSQQDLLLPLSQSILAGATSYASYKQATTKVQ